MDPEDNRGGLNLHSSVVLTAKYDCKACPSAAVQTWKCPNAMYDTVVTIILFCLRESPNIRLPASSI